MSEERLSEIMSNASRAIYEAQVTLHEAIIKAINTNFDAGIQVERERIIQLLEGYFKPEEAKSIYPANYEQYLDLIEIIKGEQE